MLIVVLVHILTYWYSYCHWYYWLLLIRYEY